MDSFVYVWFVTMIVASWVLTAIVILTVWSGKKRKLGLGDKVGLIASSLASVIIVVDLRYNLGWELGVAAAVVAIGGAVALAIGNHPSLKK